LCVKLFDFFPRWILKRLTWNLSRFVPNSVKIPTWNFNKKLFWNFFSEILCKPKLSSFKICEILLYILQYYSGSVLRWKIPKQFTQVLSYVVCTQLRRHAHKQITKGDIGKKSEDVLFSENLFCSLSVWDLLHLISLGHLVWNFYQTFNIVCFEFWLRFEPQISPIRFSIICLFITVRAKRKVRYCVKLFDFFLGEQSSVWPDICRVFSQIQ